MPVQKLQPTFNLEQDRIEMLKQLIPEAVSDGKIDWDVLKEALGEYLEDEGADVEHFGLSWAGKREARRLASIPSKGTLVPVLGEGIDEDTTGNIFIEGDNLEVLKLLQKSYAGRVKLIYIDPPYNTGNDFIYKDDFSEPITDYLKKTAQVDEDGNLLTSNPKSSGRFHSNWLSMMYPRLRLARNLLNDEGIIFISSDDNESHHLKLLMNEIFGEENFIGVFVWLSKKGGGSDSGSVVRDQEYITCYAKTNSEFSLSRIAVSAEELDKVDQNGAYRRGRELNKWGSNSRKEDRPTMFFPIPGPNGEEVFPIRNDGTEGRWRLGKKGMFDLVSQGNTEFVKRSDGKYVVYEKIRSTDPRSKPFRTFLKDVGATADGSKLVKEIFDGRKVFDFPKPIDLIKQIISMGASEEEALVLDFYAGSSTTAHAVLNINQEDGGDRKFICVQLPELTNENSEAFKAGYQTIAEISKERIRRVIKKIKDEQVGKLNLSEGDPQDLGFKVYKLDRSNLKIWKDYDGEDIQAVEQLLIDYQNPLGESLSEEKVVTELQLLEGFPLDSKIEQADSFTQNKVLCVTSEHIGHRLFICLDSKLDIATVQDVRLLEDEDIFICLDNALTDQEKMMLADGCNVKTI
jgi:adenine-specific DNA-methyltransferase